MKKFFSVLLSLCLLCAAFGGCHKGNLPVTTILTGDGSTKELPLVTVLADEPFWDSGPLRALLNTVPGSDRDFHVEFELLQEEPVRSQRIENLRVEIMAGKGPDLFLMDCFYPTLCSLSIYEDNVKSLFPFPEQARDNHLFLPLDDYIAGAQCMDRLMPQIMEVGRGEEGQTILPLQYDFTVLFMEEDQYTEPPAHSREGYLQSGNRNLERAALAADNWALLGYFGRDADYSAEELTFREEELGEIALDAAESQKKWMAGYYDRNIYQDFFGLHAQNGQSADGFCVPVYNRDQGVTAYVTSYGAINRNANYPDYAFRILDKLLSREAQKDSRLYVGEFNGGSFGLVPNLDQGEEDFQGLSMSPEGRGRFLELREQINAVKFLTQLDREAARKVCLRATASATRQSIEKAVHEACRTMEMMLAES